MNKPNVIYNLKITNPVMEKEVKDLVEYNLNVKMSSTLKKIYSIGNDIVVTVKVTVVDSSTSWYDGDFRFEYNWESLDYSRQWFSILSDLINHAFDNFKQRILAK